MCVICGCLTVVNVIFFLLSGSGLSSRPSSVSFARILMPGIRVLFTYVAIKTYLGERARERERERAREGARERERGREREREREGDKRQTERESEKEKERERQRESERQRERTD